MPLRVASPASVDVRLPLKESMAMIVFMAIDACCLD
jgi:hypothetical protein